MALKLGNNPLLNRDNKKNLQEEKEKEVERVVKQYGRLLHLNKEIIEKIDFDDKLYINRLYNDEIELEVEELKESIRKIGLINIIYLQEKENGKFRLISGLRRSQACRELYDEGFEVRGRDRIVILDKSTPLEYLDTVSVDENIQRKNLSILEQSYKFNREANKKNKKIDDILEEYNISKKSFYRIKNAMNYPQELKDIIEEVGVDKGELINKIISYSVGEDIKVLISKLKKYQRNELREVLKEVQNKKEKKQEIELKSNKNQIKFVIKNEINDDLRDYFEKLKKMIEEGDYSFIK